MNMKVVLLFLLTLIILAGVPTSLAKYQYFESLSTVYGTGSCDTCHVNGDKDGPRTSYGTLFENQPDHAANPDAALKAIGAPQTAPPEATATPTPTPVVTTVTATGTPKTPGFGIVASLVGLCALFLMAKRKK
ncbi:MAG: PGF-CTERM sorting domain-containing protein [Candidatus Methanoperedens sp.]